MSISKSIRPFLAAATVAVLGTTAVQAAGVTVSYTFDENYSSNSDPLRAQLDRTHGIGLYRDVSVYVTDESSNTVFDGLSVSAGALNLTFDAGTPSKKDVLAWCVDVLRPLTLPATYEVDPSALSSTVLTNLSRLFSVVDETQENADTRAAFQVAVWEIVEEGANTNYDITSGGFRLLSGGSVETLAAGYLNSLSNATSNVDLLVSESASQPFVTPSQVPLPASALMLGAAVAGLGVARRRK